MPLNNGNTANDEVRGKEVAMWSGLLVNLSSHRAQTLQPGPTRVEICPPAPAPRTNFLDRLLDRLADWLGEGYHRSLPADEEDSRPPAGITPLSLVRLEFVGALDDIQSRQAADLGVRIRRARSLRELWHLRADVFNAISCHCDQNEARQRLARLNRHFPARAPRSSFGGFDVLAERPVKR